mgnify:CR=1 FL=1
MTDATSEHQTTTTRTASLPQDSSVGDASSWQSYYNEQEGRYYWYQVDATAESNSNEQLDTVVDETDGDSDSKQQQRPRPLPQLDFWDSMFSPTVPSVSQGMTGNPNEHALHLKLPLAIPGMTVSISRGLQTVTNSPPNTNAIEPPEQLPDHIEMVFDEGSGQHYFYNAQTRESSWEYSPTFARQVDSEDTTSHLQQNGEADRPAASNDTPSRHSPAASSARTTLAFDHSSTAFGAALEVETLNGEVQHSSAITGYWQGLEQTKLSGSLCRNGVSATTCFR